MPSRKSVAVRLTGAALRVISTQSPESRLSDQMLVNWYTDILTGIEDASASDADLEIVGELTVSAIEAGQVALSVENMPEAVLSSFTSIAEELQRSQGAPGIRSI